MRHRKSTSSKVAEALANDATESDKEMMMGGGPAATTSQAEAPKIVFLVLTTSTSAVAPGAAPTSPTCGLEELLKQAEILRVNIVSFVKMFAESASNLKIIAYASFLCL